MKSNCLLPENRYSNEKSSLDVIKAFLEYSKICYSPVIPKGSFMMKTILYETHKNLGAKMVEFAGWSMPLFYKSTIQEYHSVRNHVGLFDVSHMGRIEIKGNGAEKFIDQITTNKINRKDFSVTYSILCNAKGGSIDDVLVFRENQNHFFLIANASNRSKDLGYCRQNAKGFEIQSLNLLEQDGILAVQGPDADSLIAEIFPASRDIEPMHFKRIKFNHEEIVVSRTGYTGAGGFELMGSNEAIKLLWEKLIDMGRKYHLSPVGLGARDLLRLDMGYALYGHELSESIAPTESVAQWAVKFNKGMFIGKEALEALEESGKKRQEYGVVLLENKIAREGYLVFQGDENIGYVTSGGYSPGLDKSIAIILVQKALNQGDRIEIEIREVHAKAEVVKLPFYVPQEKGVYHHEVHRNP
jgi:aminomethyltransferase